MTDNNGDAERKRKVINRKKKREVRREFEVCNRLQKLQNNT